MNSRNLARKRLETGASAPTVHAVQALSRFDDLPDSGERGRAEDANVMVFDFDPGHGDAAEDLAGELGAQFIEGATRVEDLSDRVNSADVASEADVPMLVEDELGPMDLNDDMPPLSAITESTRFSLEQSEGDGLPDDDGFDDDDEFDDDLDGDQLEED